MDNKLLQMALHLQKQAQSIGIPLRLLGGVAVYEKCLSQREFLKTQRNHIHIVDDNPTKEDIDFATLLSYRSKLEKFFKNNGFYIESDAASIPSSGREIFILKGKERIECDINYNELKYNTIIDFRKRFNIDRITLPIVELILSKLQPDEFKIKHKLDVQALLNQYELAENDLNAININAFRNYCCSNWCLEKNVRKNLLALTNDLLNGNEFIIDKEKILRKIAELVTILDNSPKSIRWKLQSRKFVRFIANCHYEIGEMRYDDPN